MSDDNAQDRTAQDLDLFLSQAAPYLGAAFESLADPFQGLFRASHSFISDGREVRFGVVHGAMPHLNSYRVVLDNLREVPATALGGLPLPGAAHHATYPPGARVLCLHRRDMPYAVILGAAPEMGTDGNVCFCDWTSQGSGAGMKQDGHYYEQIDRTADDGGHLDFAGKRPLDMTCLDQSVLAETGVGWHVDPFMAFLRVDEACGLWLHYHDQHAALLGVQLDIHSGCHSEEYRDDEGEATYFRGETPYPWELLGAYGPAPEAALSRMQSDKEVHYEKPLGKIEPAHDDQQPFYRYREHGGYIGQGRLREMCLPPVDAGAGICRHEGRDVYPGVFREHVGLDGSYSLVTAREYLVQRRRLIPTAKRVRLAEDRGEGADGAAQESYKAAGQWRDGPEHHVGAVALPEDTLLVASALDDRAAYLTNWLALQGFAEHPGDFHLPEESQLPGGGVAQAPLPFADLEKDMWMSLADEAESWTVDHRFGEGRYTAVVQTFYFDEIGGMVCRGGLGEEVKFQGGNVIIGCPGHLILAPGKSLVALAGDDVCLRARNSFDLTAGSGRGTIKAETDLAMLGGNSGQGGVLIESRSSGAEHRYDEPGEKSRGAGILFKSAGTVAALGSEIYLRTGHSGGAAGPIVLDAAEGKAPVISVSSEFARYVDTSIVDYFGLDNPIATNLFSSSGCLLGGAGGVRAGGSILAGGSVVAKDSVVAANGHMSSAVGGDVGRISNPSAYVAQFDAFRKAEAMSRQIGRSVYQRQVDQRFRSDNRVGSATAQRKISFSLRSEEDYGVGTSFRLPESHWQTLARQASYGMAWQEPVVQFQNEKPTLPWPGHANWNEQDTLLTLAAESFTMHDLAEGRSKDRRGDDSPYHAPKHGAFQPKKPSEAYLVIPTPNPS